MKGKWAVGALCAGVVLLGAASSEAGIIVLETGDTIVGRIDLQDVGPDHVVVRWPHGDLREKGELEVARHRIRWMDEVADAPTDAYWVQHKDAPIESRWWSARQAFIDRSREPQPDDLLLPVPVVPMSDDPLAPLPVETPDFELRKPIDWETLVEGDITMITAPRGTRARIHVFAVDSPTESRPEQLEWIKGALNKMATEEAGTDGSFNVEELYRLKQVEGGADQLMVTTTRRGERVVRALRKIMFRERRTVFFTAYADDRDYVEVEQTFHRVLATLRVRTRA